MIAIGIGIGIERRSPVAGDQGSAKTVGGDQAAYEMPACAARGMVGSPAAPVRRQAVAGQGGEPMAAARRKFDYLFQALELTIMYGYFFDTPHKVW